jgi:2-enoate reductase
MNPISGNEIDYEVVPPKGKKTMLVVGGGPGGMKAAITAAEKGMDVTLWERNAELGGNLRAAGAPDFKLDVKQGLQSLITATQKTGVKVVFGKTATAEDIIAGGYDYVTVATGSEALVPPIEGIDGPTVVTASEMLLGKRPTGKVVVIGAGLVGIESAIHASETAESVTVVEMLDSILATVAHMYNNDQCLREMFEASGAEVFTSAKVTKITEKDVTYEKDGKSVTIPADVVVLASGYKSNNQLDEELWGKVKSLKLVGDAVAPRKIIDAVTEGYHYARLAD